jgi:hypothetical protein
MKVFSLHPATAEGTFRRILWKQKAEGPKTWMWKK